MAHRLVLKKIARKMLAVEGVAAIWKLHLDAATLYQVGNPVSAETFLQIADAATEEWLRCEAAAEHGLG
jgi:hypothetical protein